MASTDKVNVPNAKVGNSIVLSNSLRNRRFLQTPLVHIFVILQARS